MEPNGRDEAGAASARETWWLMEAEIEGTSTPGLRVSSRRTRSDERISDHPKPESDPKPESKCTVLGEGRDGDGDRLQLR